jgi:hypothetical protein
MRGVTLEAARAAVEHASRRGISAHQDATVAVATDQITAVFIPVARTLVVIGDDLDNTITVSRDSAGKLLVNGGAIVVLGGRPTVANTNVIEIFGLGGNDTLSLNEANGVLPGALMFGGADLLDGAPGPIFSSSNSGLSGARNRRAPQPSGRGAQALCAAA